MRLCSTRPCARFARGSLCTTPAPTTQLRQMPETALDKARACGPVVESLLMRTDELKGVVALIRKDVDTCHELDGALRNALLQLQSLYRLINALSRHVAEVDRAVAAMEETVADSTREFNLIGAVARGSGGTALSAFFPPRTAAVKNTLSSVTRWLGASSAPAQMPPFKRPAATAVNSAAFAQELSALRDAPSGVGAGPVGNNNNDDTCFSLWREHGLDLQKVQQAPFAALTAVAAHLGSRRQRNKMAAATVRPCSLRTAPWRSPRPR